MQYGGTWNLVPAVRFPERRLLIGEPPRVRVQDIHPRSGTTARSASLVDVVVITALNEEYDEARMSTKGPSMNGRSIRVRCYWV